METGPGLWLILLTIGVVILGLAMAYGIRRNRTQSTAERNLSEAATRQEYKAEDRDAS